MERDLVRRHLSSDSVARAFLGCIELSGFGVVRAAESTARLLATGSFDEVCLLGIAGALSDAAEVGQAYEFDRVMIDGIGVGEGDSFRSDVSLGWSDQPVLDLRTSTGNDDAKPNAATLISVCAASADSTMAARRRARVSDQFTGPVAEDMEGYAVALACQAAGVPLRIIRGISNVAGNRNHAHWQMDAAVQSAVHRLRFTNSDQHNPDE